MKKLFYAAIVVSFVFAVSCGDDKKTEEAVDQDVTDIDETEEEVDLEENDIEEVVDEDTHTSSLACADFAEGMNENFVVGEGDSELARSFILKLPTDVKSKKGWPVVFLWHGYGDSPQNIQGVLSGQVDNEQMPFILVAPKARDDIFTFGLPPKGLDWDMINLADGSAEVDMFDAILNCVDEKWGVNADHVHVSGFSAGAITADSVALMRQNVVASAFTYSGAYFSDAESRADLGVIAGMTVGDFFSWPDMDEEHTKYTQVIVSGAEGKDTWATSGFTIDFNHMANFAANYLTAMEHNVILCNHGGSHSVSGPNSATMVKFFKDHPFGTEVSPYKDALPEGYDKCEFRTQPFDETTDSDEADDSDA